MKTPTLFGRIVYRTVSFSISLVVFWIVAFVLLPDFVHEWGIFIGLLMVYIFTAYVLLPISLRLKFFLTRHKRIPRYTSSSEGFPTDPVNLVFSGTLKDIKQAFAAAGWQIATPLSFASSVKMIRTFILNEPYPTAPFSNLYLFGRKQDIGFQKAVGQSPRKRHHIRLWALNDTYAANLQDGTLWNKNVTPNIKTATVWVAAATKDTGLGLTAKTLQVSHAVDKDTNAERDYIAEKLSQTGRIKKISIVEAHAQLPITGRHINKFVTDNRIKVVSLL